MVGVTRIELVTPTMSVQVIAAATMKFGSEYGDIFKTAL